jgi:tight adherence protein B
VGGGVNPAAALVGLAVVACGAVAHRARRVADGSRVHRRLTKTSARSPRTGAGRRRERTFVRTPAWLASAVADAEIPIDADRAWIGWIALTIISAAAGGALGGVALAAGGLALGAAAPLFILRARRGAAAATAEAALPGALEAVARGLRSGSSLRQAIAEAASVTPGALGAELRLVAAASERGTPLVSALEAWGARCPRPGVRLGVAALCLGAEVGGAQARAVDGVAATLRERLAVAGEVRALTSQTRASMLVIAAAPIAFCAFASATDPRTSTFLFRSPVGLACLGAGIALDVAGGLWMQRLCRIAA